MTTIKEYINRIKRNDTSLSAITISNLSLAESEDVSDDNVKRLFDALAQSNIASNIVDITINSSRHIRLRIPGNLTGLQSLSVWGGITSLILPASLTKLQTLQLDDRVTILSLPSTLTKLRWLYINVNNLTKVSRAALRAFRAKNNNVLQVNTPGGGGAAGNIATLNAVTKLSADDFIAHFNTMSLSFKDAFRLAPEVVQQEFLLNMLKCKVSKIALSGIVLHNNVIPMLTGSDIFTLNGNTRNLIEELEYLKQIFNWNTANASAPEFLIGFLNTLNAFSLKTFLSAKGTSYSEDVEKFDQEISRLLDGIQNNAYQAGSASTFPAPSNDQPNLPPTAAIHGINMQTFVDALADMGILQDLYQAFSATTGSIISAPAVTRPLSPTTPGQKFWNDWQALMRSYGIRKYVLSGAEVGTVVKPLLIREIRARNVGGGEQPSAPMQASSAGKPKTFPKLL